MNRKKILSLFIYLLVAVSLGWFFSIRLLQTPLGLTADEGGFGINAVLLSKTGHDENGRFLPFFVLSLNGTDWRQPVTQYYMTLLFKLFGSTVFNLRLTSVIIAVISTGLIYFLAKNLLDKHWAILAGLVFVTTPIIMIQAHMGLDNIMPVPFTLLWLMALLAFEKKRQPGWLLLAGISLGIGFYSYKGMRATVPVWAFLTVLYLIKDAWRQKLPAIIWFGLGLAPFWAIIPVLQKLYPGAVFDGQRPNWDSWYHFLYPYLSSFDPSYLYISGDATPWHSTGKHGMVLLASLPLFIVGLWQAIKQKKFWGFIVLVFFSAPLLYGFVDSVHRASRLLAMVPAYVLICALGAKWWWEKNKLLLVVIVAIMLTNFSDFTLFYWYKYPELTRQWFGDLSNYKDYETMGRESRRLNLIPYIDSGAVSDKDISAYFFELAYLGDRPGYVGDFDQLPPDGILLTKRVEIPGLQKLAVPMVLYSLQVSP